MFFHIRCNLRDSTSVCRSKSMPDTDPLPAPKLAISNNHLKAWSLRITSVLMGFVISNSSVYGQLEGFDEFDDGSKNPEKWDDTFTRGRGEMSESNGQLVFSTSATNGIHEAGWPWVFSSASYGEDWEFQCDVHNAVRVESSQFSSVGIYVASLEDERDLAFIEMYAAHFDEINESVHGFSAGLESGEGNQNESDSFELPTVSGALKVRFNRQEKTLSFFYHTGDTTNGFAWLRLAHYGIDGTGGTEANDDWLLTERSEFDIGVYGYTENVSIRRGEMTVDNFTADGSQALPNPIVQLYIEEVTPDVLTIGYEAFESYTFEVQESSEFNTWNPISGKSVGDGLYQMFPINRTEPLNFYRVVTTSP